MNNHLRGSITEPIRHPLDSWQERWCGPDEGLILCWEKGRELREKEPTLAERAESGELVTLPWKGGAEDIEEGGKKQGVLQYLAMWQGLRGADLDVDRDAETTVICSRRLVRVTFKRGVPSSGEEGELLPVVSGAQETT